MLLLMADTRIRANPKLMFRPEEIYSISQEISRKYAPVVAAKSFGLAKGIALSPKELLEISDEISRKYAPKLNTDKPKLVLLPIDPLHLYASWNLGVSEPKSGLKNEAQEQEFILRIYPNQAQSGSVNRPNDWFDIAIDPAKTREKVRLPKPYQASTFTAEIGTLDKHEHFNVLAASNTANTPQATLSAGRKDGSKAPPHTQSQAYSANQENLPDSRYNVSSRDVN